MFLIWSQAHALFPKIRMGPQRLQLALETRNPCAYTKGHSRKGGQLVLWDPGCDQQRSTLNRINLRHYVQYWILIKYFKSKKQQLIYSAMKYIGSFSKATFSSFRICGQSGFQLIHSFKCCFESLLHDRVHSNSFCYCFKSTIRFNKKDALQFIDCLFSALLQSSQSLPMLSLKKNPK